MWRCQWPTMASGNCSSMNNEIAGKILSEVRGSSDVREAIANEANATSTIIASIQCMSRKRVEEGTHTWDTYPKSRVKRLHKGA